MKISKFLNKWLFILLLGLPLVYTILFGFTYRLNVLSNIPMVICDTEQTKISRMLVKYYNDSDKFVVTEQVGSLEELEECLKQDRAKVGVYIPKDISKTIKYGRTPEVCIYVNATNVVYGNAALSALEEINTVVTVGAGQRVLERLSYYADEAMEAAYPAQIKVRILHNPVNGYTEFMLLGLVCNGVQIALYLYAPAMLWRRKDLMAYGVGRLLSVKQGVLILTSLLGYFLSIVIAHQIFFVPLAAPLWQFIILALAYIWLVSSLTIGFGLIFPDAVTAIQSTLIFIMPGLLYSGLSWPSQACTGLGNFIAHIFPITYVAMPMRSLSLAGQAPTFWQNIGYMSVAALALTWINFKLLGKKVAGNE